jgi:hypothetical protein
MSVPSPLAIVLVLVLVVVLVLEKCFSQRVWSTIDASSGVIRHCIPDPRSRSRTTTTRTIIGGRGTCLLAPALITDLLITDYFRPYPPPPGVSTTMQSPGATSRWSQLGSTSTRPSVRKMKVRPT